MNWADDNDDVINDEPSYDENVPEPVTIEKETDSSCDYLALDLLELA